jgi:hypothetical protein
MTRHRFALVFALVLAGGRDAAALVPGGFSPRTDCVAQWRVTTRSVAPSRGASVLDCQDGDPSCDADARPNGECVFNVSACILQNDAGAPACTAPGGRVTFRRLTPGLSPPDSGATPGCGRATPFRAEIRSDRLRGRRRPSKRIRMRMTAVAGAVRDVDRLSLRCMPAPDTCPPPGACPANPRGPGEPNALALDLRTMGSELDLGWTGHGHNVRVPGQTRLQVCLEECDTAVDFECDTRIVTGPTSENGATLGPPAPLVPGGVPICLLREYAAPVFTGGTANLATGALDATIGLRLKAYVTDVDAVCPQCLDGRCDGGANDGGACVPEATVPARGTSATYTVSRDCPPAEEHLAGVSTAIVPLTTSRSTLAAAPDGDPERPCVARPGEPAGVPPQPDACAGACDAACTGDACVGRLDGSAAGAFVCMDVHGAPSQSCCRDDTERTCFATPVERVGRPTTPIVPPPDPGPPSTIVAGGTFCAPATGSPTVDTVLGLPGPGAVSLAAGAHWLSPLPCAGGGGAPPSPY